MERGNPFGALQRVANFEALFLYKEISLWKINDNVISLYFVVGEISGEDMKSFWKGFKRGFFVLFYYFQFGEKGLDLFGNSE